MAGAGAAAYDELCSKPISSGFPRAESAGPAGIGAGAAAAAELPPPCTPGRFFRYHSNPRLPDALGGGTGEGSRFSATDDAIGSRSFSEAIGPDSSSVGENVISLSMSPPGANVGVCRKSPARRVASAVASATTGKTALEAGGAAAPCLLRSRSRAVVRVSRA